MTTVQARCAGSFAGRNHVALTCGLLAGLCSAAAPLPAGQITVRHARDLAAALERVEAGDEILLLPGVYAGAVVVRNRQGTESAPIRLRAALPDQPPVLRVSAGGVRLSGVSHVTLAGLTIEADGGPGIVVDADGTTPSQHITLTDVTLRMRDRNRTADGMQWHGVRDFVIERCRLESWGADGQGIDLTDCQRGRLTDCVLNGNQSSRVGLQMRGGSRSIVVEGCQFLNITDRCVQLGGYTSADAVTREWDGWEATDVVVRDCHFAPGEAAVTFVNAANCLVEQNVIYRPRRYVVRLLRENPVPWLTAAQTGRFSENIIVWGKGELVAAVGIGPDVDPAQFEMSQNFWYCEDDPRWSRPPYRDVLETGGVYGEDPRLADPLNWDFRPLRSRTGMQHAAASRAPWMAWLPSLGQGAWWIFLATCVVAAVRHSLRPAESNTGIDNAAVAATDATLGASARRWFGLAAVVLALLFTYGSLIPLTYRSLEWSAAVAEFERVPWLKLDAYHLADWMANLLLFAPIAYCATAAVVTARKFSITLSLAVIILWLALAGLSVGIEFLQLWFPPRTVSRNDILAECLGVAVGGLAALVTSTSLLRWWANVRISTCPTQIVDAMLQVYAVGYLVYAVMPLDVVWTRDELLAKWEAGRIGLWGEPSQDGWLQLLSLALQTAVTLPVGLAIGRWRMRRRGSPAWMSSTVCCLLLAAAIETAQLFVFTRTAALFSGVFTAVVMTLGAGFAPLLGSAFDALWTADAARQRRRWVGLGLWVYAGGLVSLMAPPWKLQFTSDAFERLNNFWAPPFASLYWGSEFRALTITAQAVLLFLPLGFAAADWSWQNNPIGLSGRRSTLAIAGLAVLAASLELLQAGLPGATVDITTTISYLGGGLLGWLLRQSLSAAVDLPDVTQPATLPLRGLGATAFNFGVVSCMAVVVTVLLAREGFNWMQAGVGPWDYAVIGELHER
jgi:VanZ family protein